MLGIVTGLRAARSRVRVSVGARDLCLSKMPHTALGAHPPPVQLVPRAPGTKTAGAKG